MAFKVFLTRNGVTLGGDDRDIMVPSEYTSQVTDWCEQMNIRAIVSYVDYWDQATQKLFGVNLWRVHDDRARMLFILRWS